MQSKETEKSKRIAKNTAILYVRMLVSMAINFYVSRIVLNTLGVEDFGIYNVVGGVVVMLSIFTGSLSASISRFMTFELGRGDKKRLRSIFSAAIVIQVLLAVAIIAIAEVGGIWFLENKMTIPEGRVDAARCVLQCSIATFALGIISVPYNAAVIAHERMKAFAYISLVESGLKLVAAWALMDIAFDKLEAHAVFLTLIAIIIRLWYGIYCKRNFDECRLTTLRPNIQLLKEMLSFAGWNFIGASSSVLRDHGVNIIINIFCGPIANAARGIATQVSGAISGFVNNFMTAVRPQITKSFAAGEHTYMHKLIIDSSRLSFYLLMLISVPIVIETPTILRLWLGIVPEHSVAFVQLTMLYIVSESISGPLITAMLATGKIRNYQIVVGSLQLLNFPVSYGLLAVGFAPESTAWAALAISQACLAARLIMLRPMINLNVAQFIKRVYINAISVAIVASIAPILVHCTMNEGIARLSAVAITSVASSALAIIFIGCTGDERKMIYNKLASLRKQSVKPRNDK